MNKMNMFLNDTTLKNKENNNFEKKNPKRPLLQIFFKNNKKGKSINQKTLIPKSPKLPKYNQSFNFNYQNKHSVLNVTEKNVTPIKKLKNNRYILSSDKSLKNEDLYSYFLDEEINEKKNKNNNNNNTQSRNININNRGQNISFDIYTISNSTNNNSILPNLSRNTNLFRLQKRVNNDKNIISKNRRNNLIFNNINFNNNSNSIFVSESTLKKYPFFQRSLGNKVLNQKSLDSRLLTNDSNNYNSIKNINLKDSSNLRLNTESIDNTNNIYKIKKRNIKKNDLLFSFSNEKKVLSEKKNKPNKDIYSNNELINSDISINKEKPNGKEELLEMRKNKNFLTIVPKNNNKNLKISIESSNIEKPEKNNKKKIFLMKKKTNDEKKQDEDSKGVIENNNNVIKNYKINIDNNTIKKNIQKNLNSINNKKIIENTKTENNNKNVQDIKDIKKPSNNIYDIIKNKNNYNITKGTDINKKIILFNKESKTKYDMNKDEEKYIRKKKLKMMKEIEKNNKSSDLYHIFKKEIKKYFLKNCVIDKITQKIFDNFEPLYIKEKEKDIMEKNIDKLENDYNKFFDELILKYYKYCSEDIDNLELFFLKEETKIRIRNNLNMFDIFQELLKQFEGKWVNQKRNECYYKKICQFYSMDNPNYTNDPLDEEDPSFFEKIDKKFYVYKERTRREYNLYLDSLKLKSNLIFEEEKEELNEKREERRQKTKKHTFMKFHKDKKKFPLSKSLKLNISLEENKNKNKINNITSPKEKSKKSTFSKIQKDYGFVRSTRSLEKFSKLYRISPFSKMSTKVLNELSNGNKEKEKIFNNAKKDINNYNILKNSNLFRYTSKSQVSIDKKQGNNEKDKIQLNKRLKRDNMIIRFSGISQLTREASAIKTREMNQDSPFVKLFEKFINLLLKRELDQFIDLMETEKEDFNKILNMQEFSTGNTLLIYATQNNIISIVELLLLKGADPNIQNEFGNTALHIAFSNNNSFIINLLFENHADQKIKNIKGLFPWQMSKNLND